MENMFLVKIETNVNQRKHIHDNFYLTFFTQLNRLEFDHQNWSDFLISERFNSFFHKNVPLVSAHS